MDAQTITAICTLIGTLVGLIPGIVAAITAIVKLFKDRKAADVWKIVMSIADAAMKQVEKSAAKGEDKKTMAIEIVKASCASQGIAIDGLVDQLAAYIDNCIDFVNGMTK